MKSVKEVRGLKCPNHDYVRDNRHFMYPERSLQLLNEQTPLSKIIQEAYNVADDIERDILRKLKYLALCKRTDSDNDSDSILGRLEAISMIEEDKYSLRY